MDLASESNGINWQGIQYRPSPVFLDTNDTPLMSHADFTMIFFHFNTDIKHNWVSFILASTDTYLDWTSLSWSPRLSVSTCSWCHTTQHQSEVACRTVCRKSVLSNQRQNCRREHSKCDIALCSGGVTIGFGPTLRSCHSFFALSQYDRRGENRFE